MRTKPPLVLSISDLNHWLDCHYAAVWKYTNKLWTGVGKSARVGTALHAYIQWRLGGLPCAPSMKDLDEEILPDYAAGVGMLQDWTPDFKTLSTETAFKLAFGWGHLVGRLDGVVEDEEGKWSFQVKTLAKGTKPAPVLARMRLSHHEVAYHVMAHRAGVELQGTILLILRQLSQKDTADGVSPISVTRLRRTYEEAEEVFYQDLVPALNDFSEDIDYFPTYDPQRNRQACISRYRQVCPLFDACHKAGPIDLTALVRMDDRYADLGLTPSEPQPPGTRVDSAPAPLPANPGAQAPA